MPDYQLTDKALFPATDGEAIRQLAEALAVTQEYLHEFVLATNTDSDALQLWNVVRAMTKAVTVYNG
ncbi:MAG: hypothetical protein LC650_00510 [Actinobacteria bacterium]|nr:hypothetical protein [Actinomycetota bacterium]